MQKRKKVVSIILLVLWMIVIFVMSSFDGNDSSEQSGFFVDIIVNTFKITDVSLVSLIIRKIGHFVEYLILGILFTNVLKVYNKTLYLGIIYSIIYSISDEIHQAFVPQRACRITDVLIDTLGIIAGYLIYRLILRIKKKNI